MVTSLPFSGYHAYPVTEVTSVGLGLKEELGVGHEVQLRDNVTVLL
jgi:hypothetical protein